MLNIDDTTKELYKSDSVPKEITISFPNASITYHNDDIVSESLEIEEHINDGEELTFEGCLPSVMKFKCDSPVRDLRGEYVEVSIKAFSDTTSYEPVDISLFKGYIDEQTNRTQEDVVTEFVAYDRLYIIGQQDITSWYNGLTFPITIKNFRDSLFTQLGITQETVDLINDSKTINKITTKDQILVIDVLKAICQANARFGQIGRDGKFHYRKLREITQGLYPSTETFPSDTTYPSKENADTKYSSSDYIKVTYEPFKTAEIDTVYIIGQDGTKTIAGSGTEVLAIADNIVAQGCTDKSSMASAILGELNNIVYVPSEVNAKGYPWIECGDIYMFNTKKNVVRAYVLNRVLKGIQALYDTFTTQGSQTRETYQETTATQMSTREKSIQDNTLKIGTVEANLVITNQIVATKASISDLNAVSARVGTLEADHVSVAQLNATNAYISALSAIAITTQNLSAQSISGGQITSGTISANRISSDIMRSADLTATLINSKLSSTSTLIVGGRNYTARAFSYEGNNWYILGADRPY